MLLRPESVDLACSHRMLMLDGSIAKDETGLPHNLHKVKEKGENELFLDRAWRVFKESV